jgi:hypothetical protein
LAAYGADVSALPDELRKPKEFEVIQDNWPAVLMFLRVESQWRTTSSGVMGLDYNVLLGPGALLDLYDVEDPRQVFEDLQVIEGRARQLLNEAAQKEIKKAQQTGKKRR